MASTIRWLVVDRIHHATGVRQPEWNFSRLQENIVAFEVLVEIHYRYYQFYGNMLVAVLFVYATKVAGCGSWMELAWTTAGVSAAAVVLFLGSRDTLAKYYARADQLLKVRMEADTRQIDRVSV